MRRHFIALWAPVRLYRVRVRVTYDWRFTANNSSWRQAPWHSRHSNFIFQLNICDYGPYIISSLTRGWACSLQLVLALASAVILRSDYSGNRDHNLLSIIRDSPNLVRVRVTLRLTVSQSVCLGVEPQIIYLICWKLQSCLWGRPLWREVGSVACQSVICVMSLSVCIYKVFTKHITYKMNCLIYNMYKASVSPGSVQQIMPYC
jgi:hypothetical protein